MGGVSIEVEGGTGGVVGFGAGGSLATAAAVVGAPGAVGARVWVASGGPAHAAIKHEAAAMADIRAGTRARRSGTLIPAWSVRA